MRESASEASGVGPFADAASSRDRPKPTTRDSEIGRGDQDMSNGDITLRVDRDKREPEDNGRGVGSPTKMQKTSSDTIGHGAADKLGEAP